MDTVQVLRYKGKNYRFFDLSKLGSERVRRLPYSLRILLENVVRNQDRGATPAMVEAILSNEDRTKSPVYEVPFYPARVLMQDFTGVPAIVDLAAMRDAVQERGGNPESVNPSIPVDLIVDHSVQIDFFGQTDSLAKNVEKEYERNSERYSLLKWAQKSFKNFRVVPPNSGICHQVNLEYLGSIARKTQDSDILIPDTLVGTDSHTTMINGLGIMGWGVGGIEAEAAILGEPLWMPIPDVVGFRLLGKLPAGTTATDLVLTVTEMLRSYGVVDKFVEFFGPGLSSLSLPDRATIANMSPEYGATMGFFPVDQVSLEYLRFTGRDEAADLAELYCRANLLFVEGPDPEYHRVLELDLNKVRPTLAGPAKPHEKISLKDTRAAYKKLLNGEGRSVTVDLDGEKLTIQEGAVVIASITSCTNTSNPEVMLASGLLAKKAWEAGLRVPSWVKTSLAPGSKAVEDYLRKSGLLDYLEKFRFHIAAYGCVTCIGNSGPLHPSLEKVQTEQNLTFCAVLSGNRNFTGRVHPNVKASFLASPPLVVAYALAGTMNIDLETEPLGEVNGKKVFLKDIWPGKEEVEDLIKRFVTRETYLEKYKSIFEGDVYWKNLSSPSGKTYRWEDKSTYIRKPPYFEGLEMVPPELPNKIEARCLALLGDTISTDHISPAGNIRANYPAGQYLQGLGVQPKDFNSYGTRRGNHEVMIRGTFGNTRLQNRLVNKEGSYTLKFPERRECFIYEACSEYQQEGVDLLVIAGKFYGSGSSRDWAAKGTLLLGIKAVLAESFERIHRSNLIGMGVLPLQFIENQNAETLGLAGDEFYTILGMDKLSPNCLLDIEVRDDNGGKKTFKALCRIQTEAELQTYRHGGIMPYVVRSLLRNPARG